MPPRKKKAKNEETMITVTPRKAAPAWFKDCPVHDDDPLMMEDWKQPSLPPGPALEACSGSDIYYQKANSKRSKYLAILPGLMAFDHQKTQQRSNKDSASTVEDNDAKPSATKTSLSQETFDTEPLTQESWLNESVKASVTPAKKTAEATTMVMGQISGLHSETSTQLSLPLDATRYLQFQGHKVSTSSKFVVLTLHPKKGRVVCKDVFSSAIVFGNPRVVEHTRNQERGDLLVVDEEEEEKKVPASTESISLEHYGGSCRAWDGTMQGQISNKTIAASGLQSNKPTSTDQILVKSDEETDDNHDEDDQKANDSDEYRIDLSNSSPVVKRTAPRRQSRKQVKYTELNGGESSDSDKDSESLVDKKGKQQKSKQLNHVEEIQISSDEETSTSDSVPATRKQSSATLKQSAKGKKKKPPQQLKKGRGSADSSVKIVSPKGLTNTNGLKDDDSNDEDFEMKLGGEAAANLPRRPPSRRLSSRKTSSASRQSNVETDDDDEDNSDASDDVESSQEEMKQQKSQRKATVAKSTLSKKPLVNSRKSTPSLSQKDAEIDKEESGPSEDEVKETRQRRQSRTQNGSVMGTAKSSAIKRPRRNSLRMEEEEDSNAEEDEVSRKRATSQKQPQRMSSRQTSATKTKINRRAISRPSHSPDLDSDSNLSEKDSIPGEKSSRSVSTRIRGNSSRKRPVGSTGMNEDSDSQEEYNADSRRNDEKPKDEDSDAVVESSQKAPLNRRRRAPSSGKKMSKEPTLISLLDDDQSMDLEKLPINKSAKKLREGTDEDSDGSFQPSRKRKNLPSATKKGGTALKFQKASRNKDTKDEGENADITNRESPMKALDSEEVKSIFAKAILKGKASRPSPPKSTTSSTELLFETSSPPSNRRRRATPSKSSAEKKSIRHLTDDNEFTFL